MNLLNDTSGPDLNAMHAIRRMAERIVSEYKPERVYLFGSYAYGEPDGGSDVDLLIVKQTDDRFIDRWTAVQGLLTGITGRLPVETIVLTPAELSARIAGGDQFIKEIVARGRLLYAA